MTESTLPVPAQPADTGLMTFGQTNLDPGDVIMPRVKLLQAQSEEISDATLDVKVGDWFNTLTQIGYGPTLRFVPILPFKQRVFLVRSERIAVINAALTGAGLEPFEKDASGLKCRSYDMEQGQGSPGIACHECPLSAWNGTEPPLCSETYNVAATSEEGELIVLSFQKSSARVGKQLFSMIRMRPGAQATVFEATSFSEKGSKGTYQVPRIRPIERAAPELIRQVMTWAQQLKGVTLDVTPEDEGDAGEASGQPF